MTNKTIFIPKNVFQNFMELFYIASNLLPNKFNRLTSAKYLKSFRKMYLVLNSCLLNSWFRQRSKAQIS